MILSSPFLSRSPAPTSLSLHGSVPKPPSCAFPATLPATSLTIEAARRVFGRVVTTKSDKTVGVVVVRMADNAKYRCTLRVRTKFYAHDPENQLKVGDTVELVQSRPFSKSKHYLAIPSPPHPTIPTLKPVRLTRAQIRALRQSESESESPADQDQPTE